MSVEFELSQFRKAIKMLLKEQKKTYQMLADHLDVSEITIKRNLNDGELTVERMLTICEWLGVKIEDLLVYAREQPPAPEDMMSEIQEGFLASDPNYFAFWNQLYSGHHIDDISQNFQLNKKSLEKYVRELEKMELVTVSQNGSVKIRRFKVRFRPGGILYRRYAAGAAEAFFEAMKQVSVDETLGEQLWKDGQLKIEMSDYALTQESYDAFNRELAEIKQKYYETYLVEKRLGKLGREKAKILLNLNMRLFHSDDRITTDLMNRMKDFRSIGNI